MAGKQKSTPRESDLLDRPLSDCPVRKGFRQRGVDMTRMETFTDAAFAFAVTLLVISIDAVPTNFSELAFALRDIPAFAFSFLILMMFWHGHWTWSRRFGLEDAASIWLSGGLVFIVLCFVYPLKFIASLFMHYFSGGFLSPTANISNPDELFEAFAVYGVGFCAMAAIILLLNRHAWRLREPLGMNELERFDTRMEMWAWTILGGVGLLSLGLALFGPRIYTLWPGWAYMLLGVVMPVFGVKTSKYRRALEERLG